MFLAGDPQILCVTKQNLVPQRTGAWDLRVTGKLFASRNNALDFSWGGGGVSWLRLLVDLIIFSSQVPG